MRTARGIVIFISCLCWAALPLLASGQPDSLRIRLLTVAASINPATASFIIEQIEQGNKEQDRAILLQLDTPGGLDSAMRDIIQAELNSTIPVIVYVAPQGARAASAGAFITIAADFAAMAPGTNIGAAHPVGIGGGQAEGPMADKVTNDAVAYARSLAEQRGRNPEWAEKAVRQSASISAAAALEQQVVDFVASDTEDLLRQLDSLTYLRNGQKKQLATAGATLVAVKMNWRQKVLNSIANPNIAYLLLMLGILGIFFEISQPGVVLPGVIGAVAILLALFGLSALPVNYVGILLILLAFVFFILEVKVVSYGMLSVCGIVAMAFGSLMLIDSSEPYLQISRALIAACVSVSAGFFLFAVTMVVRTQRRPAISGQEGMVGEYGTVIKTIDGRGTVFVHGEYWQASADVPIPEGSEIEVIGVSHGLELLVKPKKNDKKEE